MKRLTYVVTALYPDATSDDEIRQAALAAFVQFQEPETGEGPEVIGDGLEIVERDRHETACDIAAGHQGLFPMTAALTAAGIPHRVEQTGGLTMVVVVPCNRGNYVISGPDEGEGYLNGLYFGDDWENGFEADEVYRLSIRAIIGSIQFTQSNPPV